jgi:hypothetical protein
MSSVPEQTKTPTITTSITVTSPAKPDMSTAELQAYLKRANELKKAAAAFGTVEGHVQIGRLRYSLRN